MANSVETRKFAASQDREPVAMTGKDKPYIVVVSFMVAAKGESEAVEIVQEELWGSNTHYNIDDVVLDYGYLPDFDTEPLPPLEADMYTFGEGEEL